MNLHKVLTRNYCLSYMYLRHGRSGSERNTRQEHDNACEFHGERKILCVRF